MDKPIRKMARPRNSALPADTGSPGPLSGDERPAPRPRPLSKKPRTTAGLPIEVNHSAPDDQCESEGPLDAPKGDYKISSDNDFFNAIKAGKSAIEPMLDDWIEMYQGNGVGDEDAKAEALAVLLNFVLRCCGCNHVISKHEATDLDAVPDTLDTIQSTFKLVPGKAYPLIAKGNTAVAKSFGKRLSSMLVQLVKSLHANSILYDDHYIPTIQSFLVSMSSSTLRSFRHTSTFISLFGFMKGLSDVLADVRKELGSLLRKVELETKKQHQDKSSQGKKAGQLLEWEKRKKQVHSQKAAIEGYLGDFFDGVFVHRYRDADPSIRANCVQALGQWINSVPDYFLQSNYLRYIGWVLADNNKDARNEALRVLNTLYSKDEYIGAMQHFTTRSRSRLIQMATGETDLTSRSLAVNILTMLDRHGLLESKHRRQLGRLIYHEDSRVRRASGAFFSNLLSDAVDARKVRMDALSENSAMDLETQAGDSSSSLEQRVKFKCLARLLTSLGKESTPDPNQGNVGSQEDLTGSDQLSASNDGARELESKDVVLSALMRTYPEKGRIAMAVEDLWGQVETLRDWVGLSHYLLLDHTASTCRGTQPSSRLQPSSRRVNQRHTGRGTRESGDIGVGNSKDNSLVEKACKMTELEESVLVEVFVASLRKFSSSLTPEEALRQRKRKKKNTRHAKTQLTGGEEENSASESETSTQDAELLEENTNKIEMTRVMIPLLPKLWLKFSADPARLAEVFRIPKLMCLNLYLDLRMVSAFEQLWDTIHKQYLQQQRVEAIQSIASTIDHVLSSARSLHHVSQSKVTQLDQVLILSLSDLTYDKGDIETESMDEDEVVSLTLLLIKIANLVRQRNLTEILHNKVKADRLNPLDVVISLANRGRLAHENEAKLVEVALEIIQLNFMWYSANVHRLASTEVKAGDEPEPQESFDSQLKQEIIRALAFRDVLVEFLTEYVFGSLTQPCGAVKRAAFIHLLNTYLLCYGTLMPEELQLQCDEETQLRCSRFVREEIRKFMKCYLSDHASSGEPESDDGPASKLSGNGRSRAKDFPLPLSPGHSGSLLDFEDLRRFEELDLVVTTFSKSIRCGLLHFSHSAVLLPYYHRISQVFDSSVEVLIGNFNDVLDQDLTQTGLMAEGFKTALIESLEMFVHGEVETDDQFIRLARLLQSVIVLRGARMSFTARFTPQAYIQLHSGCIEWLTKCRNELESDANMKDKAGALFKGLGVLLLGMDGRAALKTKSHMDRSLEQHDFVIPATSKAWDPFRQYSKRLMALISKDPNTKDSVKNILTSENGLRQVGDVLAPVNGTSQKSVMKAGRQVKSGRNTAGVKLQARKTGPPRNKQRSSHSPASALDDVHSDFSITPPPPPRGSVKVVVENTRRQKAGFRQTKKPIKGPSQSGVQSDVIPASSRLGASRSRRASSVVSVVIPSSSASKPAYRKEKKMSSLSSSAVCNDGDGGTTKLMDVIGHQPVHKRSRLQLVVVGGKSKIKSNMNNTARASAKVKPSSSAAAAGGGRGSINRRHRPRTDETQGSALSGGRSESSSPSAVDEHESGDSPSGGTSPHDNDDGDNDDDQDGDRRSESTDISLSALKRKRR